MTIPDWLEAKGQIDFGNLSVGAATAIVAVLSFYVTNKNISANRKQKIAEFRQQWIDDLRNAFADLIGLAYEITNKTVSAEESHVQKSGFDQLHSKVMRSEAYIKLKLNPEEALHKALVEDIANLRGHLASFSLESTRELHVRIDDLASRISHNAKLVLKEEWDRVKIELR